MKNQQGIILIITLIFLMLLSLFAIAALETTIEQKKLVNLQQKHRQLFDSAENELRSAEQQIAHLNIKLSLPSKLITDKQIQSDQITPQILQHCNNIGDLQKNCYFIELLAQENCAAEINQQLFTAYYYRVTARVSLATLINQNIILQSTYLLLPESIHQCEKSPTEKNNTQIMYVGRQSWREIM